MGVKIIIKNKKAFHGFEIIDKIEAGVSLVGTEVKALRDGRANLTDGWVDFDGYDVWLKEVHIGHFSHGNRNNHAEKRARRLLLNKKEIVKLSHLVASKGMTVIPIALYFKNSRIKVEIATARGKKQYDKREANKQKDVKKKLRRVLKER